MTTEPTSHATSQTAPGQHKPESVWDYPRPPRLEPVPELLRVVFANETIANTARAYRVLETSHPPAYYFPTTDVRRDWLRPARSRSFCEFKGLAQYWTIEGNDRCSGNAAWSYPDPAPAFRPIKDFLAFYVSRVDECWVGEHRVEAQEGDFYGGWITPWIVGPFKGGPGTQGW